MLFPLPEKSIARYVHPSRQLWRGGYYLRNFVNRLVKLVPRERGTMMRFSTADAKGCEQQRYAGAR